MKTKEKVYTIDEFLKLPDAENWVFCPEGGEPYRFVKVNKSALDRKAEELDAREKALAEKEEDILILKAKLHAYESKEAEGGDYDVATDKIMEAQKLMRDALEKLDQSMSLILESTDCE